MTHSFQIGDTVAFRWWFMYPFGMSRRGTVHDVAGNGRRVQIKVVETNSYGSQDTTYVWRAAWRVRTIAPATASAFVGIGSRMFQYGRPSDGIGGQILSELDALDQHLGSGDAVLELLREIRKSYESSGKGRLT